MTDGWWTMLRRPRWGRAVLAVVILEAVRSIRASGTSFAALDGYRALGLPCIEVYRTNTIRPDFALNETDIYVPVERERTPRRGSRRGTSRQSSSPAPPQ